MHQHHTKSTAVVQNTLDKLGLTCPIMEFSTSTRTAHDAASCLGCHVSQIVKSLIFKTQMTHRPVLTLVSGANIVHLPLLEEIVGEPLTKADAAFVKAVTGFAIGGVPPLGAKTPIPFIFIDQDLLMHTDVWAAAGTPNAVLCIKIADLIKATQGHVMALSKEKLTP